MKDRFSPLTYYPVFLNVHGKRCIVVGGGKVAVRKIKALLDCGANVTVVSPSLDPDLAKLTEAKMIGLLSRDYESGDLKDAFLVIAATDKTETNLKVAEEARKLGIPMNIVDSPERSDFIIPSFFRRDDLTVAISTAGVSPALARRLRLRLERTLGEEYGGLLSLIGEVRSELKNQKERIDAEAWQKALDLDVLIGLVREGERDKARALLLEKLKG